MNYITLVYKSYAVSIVCESVNNEMLLEIH